MSRSPNIHFDNSMKVKNQKSSLNISQIINNNKIEIQSYNRQLTAEVTKRNNDKDSLHSFDNYDEEYNNTILN